MSGTTTAEPLPHGPDETHVGRTVRRTLCGETHEGVVTKADPFGGWVRIDGRFLRADLGRWELLPEHKPLRVFTAEGIPFVTCSCRDDMSPQSAVWLREHWTGSEDEGVAALNTVVALQAAEVAQ